MLTYRINPTGTDIDGELSPAVFISCGNCATLSDIDESIECDTNKS
jgi:hypothetical protein